MKFNIFLIALGFLCIFSIQGWAETQDEQRLAIQTMKTETLKKLYYAKPSAREEIKNASGYAVFSSAHAAAIYFSGSYGHGLAHENHTGDEAYMRTASLGIGLGLGVKDFRTIFIFDTLEALRNFENVGLDFSGSLNLDAKKGAKGISAGGAQDILPGVKVYQLTETGLLAQVMLEGTRYWRDTDMNAYEQSSDAGDSFYQYNNRE